MFSENAVYKGHLQLNMHALRALHIHDWGLFGG
jgi:hypothetical protein